MILKLDALWYPLKKLKRSYIFDSFYPRNYSKIFSLPPVLLRYKWHIILYKFKVDNVTI